MTVNFYLQIGGGNFSEKEVALCILASKCDGLVFVGNLAFQINHALGLPVPHRLLEHNGQNHFIQKVLGLVQLARHRNVPIFTPMDFLCKNDSDPQLLDIFHINKILNGEYKVGFLLSFTLYTFYLPFRKVACLTIFTTFLYLF